jgi:hypothetical protein
LDSTTDGLKQDLTVAVTSTTTPVKRTWSKGTLPGVFPVPLTLAREVERWPFDSYYAGPITVELFVGTGQAPERANVTFVDWLTGWKVQAKRLKKANPMSPYEVELQRSASTMLFAFVILLIFVAIGAVGVFVAIQTLRDPRRFQSPLTTWYAAMLFAVVPLRNALSRLAGIRKLDRPHNRFVGTSRFGDLDAGVYRGLVAIDIEDLSRPARPARAVCAVPRDSPARL